MERRTDKRTKIEYKDVPGFCKATSLEEIRKQGHPLTPGRYVGYKEEEEDDELFEEKMERLTSELGKQINEAKELDHLIEQNLESIGYDLNRETKI